MQTLVHIPTIRTSLAAAAITVAAMTMMGGTASATTMHPSEHHGNVHVSQQHQEHENNNNHHRQMQHGQHQGHEQRKQHEQQRQDHNGHQSNAQHAMQNHGQTNHSQAQSHSQSQNHQEQNQADQQSQAAVDLRVGLNNLLAEHVTTNLNVNRSIAGGASAEQIEAGMQAQVANSQAISAAVGSIYGTEAQAQFYEMFQEHIDESNRYAQAIAAGDEAARTAANEELQEYLREIATFFSTAIPVLPYEDVYALLNQHEELINASTVAFEAGNFGQSYQIEHDALKQVAMIADALAAGIVATQPDKF